MDKLVKFFGRIRKFLGGTSGSLGSHRRLINHPWMAKAGAGVRATRRWALKNRGAIAAGAGLTGAAVAAGYLISDDDSEHSTGSYRNSMGFYDPNVETEMLARRRRQEFTNSMRDLRASLGDLVGPATKHGDAAHSDYAAVAKCITLFFAVLNRIENAELDAFANSLVLLQVSLYDLGLDLEFYEEPEVQMTELMDWQLAHSKAHTHQDSLERVLSAMSLRLKISAN